jgi:polyhydroxyalkanoate synthesis regulator phasin
MERRDRSLKALERLYYIDSLDNGEIKAESLSSWVKEYLQESSIEDFDLETNDLKKLSELLYKNTNFMKNHRTYLKEQLDSTHKIKEFLH